MTCTPKCGPRHTIVCPVRGGKYHKTGVSGASSKIRVSRLKSQSIRNEALALLELLGEG